LAENGGTPPESLRLVESLTGVGGDRAVAFLARLVEAAKGDEAKVLRLMAEAEKRPGLEPMKWVIEQIVPPFRPRAVTCNPIPYRNAFRLVDREVAHG